MTMREAWARYEREWILPQLSPAAIKERAWTLRTVTFMDLPLTAVDRPTVKRWFDGLTAQVATGDIARATANVHRAHLSAFFNWCVREALLPDSPLRTIAALRDRRIVDAEVPVLTSEEAAHCLAAARTMGEPWASMFAVSLWTGLRPGEVVALDWEDIDLDAGTILVRKARAKGVLSPTKSRRPRRIALGAEAVSVLRRVRRPDLAKGAVWPAETPSGYSHPSTLTRRWKRIYGEAGLPAARVEELSAYILRHTAATALRRAGAPVGAIQDQLGHVSEGTTRRYLRLSGNEAAPYIDGALTRMGAPVAPASA